MCLVRRPHGGGEGEKERDTEKRERPTVGREREKGGEANRRVQGVKRRERDDNKDRPRSASQRRKTRKRPTPIGGH